MKLFNSLQDGCDTHPHPTSLPQKNCDMDPRRGGTALREIKRFTNKALGTCKRPTRVGRIALGGDDAQTRLGAHSSGHNVTFSPRNPSDEQETAVGGVHTPIQADVWEEQVAIKDHGWGRSRG